MKILCLGDVYGQPGFEMLRTELPKLRLSLALDFVLVNAENAAAGRGLRPDQADALIEAGADALTLGNHAWDFKPLRDYACHQHRLIRPINFDPNAPGQGKALIKTQAGKRVLVLQLQGKIFMRHVSNPYAVLQQALEQETLGKTADVILIDVHAECASEKQIVGYMMDGKVTAVFGTHTHVPTADQQIFPNGTAYQTDLGMCGVQRSVVGFDVEAAIQRFAMKDKSVDLVAAQGQVQLNGLLIQTDKTGLTKHVERFVL